MSREPTDADRYPTLSDAGRAVLMHMTEHPHAPVFRNRSGNRLLHEEVEGLRDYERNEGQAPFAWSPGVTPPWLGAFVAHVHAEVPYYRSRGLPPSFDRIATVDRGDLAADVARFVPDSVSLDRLINFRTTGTTGHPLVLPSHPVVAGRYLAYHKRALRRAGITLRQGRGDVGVMLLGMQRTCFTYVSVTPSMDESGLAKINLHPDDWRDAGDRARYIDAMRPEVIAGDPISFAELLRLPVRHRPTALLSVSMALSPSLAAALQERFACPVLDIYSMNEAGPLAVYDEALGGHLLLQPGMFVEVVDASGRPVAPGETGEITLTGGFNFCLPLLRYRTGDHGALVASDEGPVIARLHGRQPVRYQTASGSWVNNIDLTHALLAYPLSRYTVHQYADRRVLLRLAPGDVVHADEASASLASALHGAEVTVVPLAGDDKVLQYTTDVPEGLTR
ncbi:MAG: AMP-binding protein [Luteibacter sp.]|uniref:AMP-binding protein n=1 Tax=Luteibacter sp. TaxID=1886636 RepID=UPI002807A248|nr:AMP-binding protein [Luteibacter sp.]MDQ7995019.1 AMP-binding protein [Luteibacter sp.]